MRSTGLAPHAAVVPLLEDAAVALHGDVQPFAERVGAFDADAVQAAGDLVALGVAELAAGVQLGQHHFQRADLLFGMLEHRDAAPVVLDGMEPSL